MWAETATEDEVAIACITGGACEIGDPGAMKLVEPSDADLARSVTRSLMTSCSPAGPSAAARNVHGDLEPDGRQGPRHDRDGQIAF